MNKPINHFAPVKYEKSISINATSDKVWSLLTNIDWWAAWQKDICEAKVNGELKPTTTFYWKSGGVKIQSTIHTVKPYENFGWTGRALGLFVIHNWVLKRENRKTIVFVSESIDGIFASLFRKKFNKNLKASMELWLYFLKMECENL